FFFFFQAEDGIRDFHVTGVQTCALPISPCSQRDVVVGEVLAEIGLRRRRGLAPLGRGAALLRAILALAALAAALASTAEHLHLRSEERRVGEGSGPRGAASH